jgi:hypothetical protein
MFTAPLSIQTNLKPAHRSQCHEKQPLDGFPRSTKLRETEFSGPHFGSNKPPQGKLPLWIRALALSGVGLIGWGQFPSKPTQTETIQHSQTEKQALTTISLDASRQDGTAIQDNKPQETEILYCKDGVDINYIDLGPSNEELLKSTEGESAIGIFNIGKYVPNQDLPLYRQAIRNICQNHTAKELSDLKPHGWERLIKDEVTNLQCIAEAEAFQSQQIKSTP